MSNRDKISGGFTEWSGEGHLPASATKRRIIPLFFLLLFASGLSGVYAEKSPPRNVFVLNSYNPGYKWSDSIVEGIRSVLGNDTTVEYFVEYMDAKRHETPLDVELLGKLYEHRYRDKDFDVAIVCDNNAFDFILARRENILPHTPIVFCGVNNFNPDSLKGHSNITGVAEDTDFRGTIELAIKLHPGLRQMVVVSDATATSLVNLDLARSIVDAFTNRLNFLFLHNLSTEELKDQLENIDPRSAIFVVSFFRDRNGRVFSLEEGLDFIVSNSRVPVYCCWDSFIQQGVLGGRVISAIAQGKTAGGMAKRIVEGESADQIPIRRDSPNVDMFDYRQLARFGIRLNELPQGAVLLNEPFSFYDKYRVWILGLASLILIETMMILLLFISRSHRLQAEAALRESQKQMVTLSNNLNAAIYQCIATSPNNVRFVYMSGGIEKILGILASDIVNDSSVLFSRVVGEDRAGMIEAREQSLLRRKTFDHELRVRDIRDQVKWLRFCSEPRTEKGRIVWDGFIVDVTSRRQAEEERRNLDAQIQQTQKLESLGVLAGGIAHDFNNLLMGILGNAELATDEIPSSSPAWVNVRDIKTAARRAADLCRQLLAYSGRGRFVIESVDLNRVVEEMAQLLDVSISKNVVLKQSFANNLPHIKADPTQIRQIIMNLITNASEAIGTKSGIISISTGAMDCDKAFLRNTLLSDDLSEGLYAYIEVSDTGCGMTGDTVKRIFDPFYTSKFTGRGLGLAAVLGIVRGHKGAIKLDSRAGRGTTFRVLFPAVEPSAQEAGREDRKTPHGEWKGSGTFLLVDDEETIRAIGKRMLEKMGYKVVTASNGKEAVEAFQRQPRDIVGVLLDLTMPHMDGEETFRQLHVIDHNLRIILSSGYTEQEIASRFTERSPAGFIQKPYQYDNLADVLRRVMTD